MEIHPLKYVLELEKRRNFTLAAEHLFVSQAALSQQIKKLEAELGIELFVRTTRSVQLSPAGEEFNVFAKRILSEIEQSRIAVLEHTDLKKGYLKIGAIRTITYLGITAEIAAFQKEYPGIHLQLFEENTDELIKKLNTYEIDVAFINAPFVSQNDFDFYPLITDKLVLVIPSSHVLANRKVLHSLSEVSKEKFLVMKSSRRFARDYPILTAS